MVARQVATGVSLVIGAGWGLTLTDAGQAFNLLLLLGAGTGGLFAPLVLVAHFRMDGGGGHAHLVGGGGVFPGPTRGWA